MTTLEIIQLIAIIVAAVVLGVFYAIKAIKNKWLSKVYNAIKDGIVEAEKTSLTGKAKKEYVLKHVQLICDNEGIPFNVIKKLVDKSIEKLVEGYNTIAKS